MPMSFYSSKEDLDRSFHFCLCLCWQLYHWELQRISQPGKGRKRHLYIPKLSKLSAAWSFFCCAKLQPFIPFFSSGSILLKQNTILPLCNFIKFTLCSKLVHAEASVNFFIPRKHRKTWGHILFFRDIDNFFGGMHPSNQEQNVGSFAKISLH